MPTPYPYPHSDPSPATSTNAPSRWPALVLPAAVGSLLVATGCARVNVTPISDANRMTAQGFRYYLPRPFVSVKKPFPISGEEFLVSGLVDADSRLIQFNASELPPTVRQKLGGGVPLTSVTVATLPSGGSPAPLERQSTASSPSPSPSPVPADEWLKGSTVSPPQLDPEVDAFAVTLKLSPKAPLDGLVTVQPGLVPIGPDGKPIPSRFLALTTRAGASVAWKKGEIEGVYPVSGLRSTLPKETAYAVAARIQSQVQVDGQATTVESVYHATRAALTVVGPTGDAKDEQKEEKTTTVAETGPKSATTATLATAGNPATSPLQPVNDLFDIVYLPDFDEQYAVRVRGGLGQASANVGLEQGWQMEQAAVQIDNRELGKFVFENTTKLIDLAVKAGGAALGIPLPTAAGAGDTLAQQATRPGTQVLLKVRLLSEAQPGLYPVLKPQEAREALRTPDQAVPHGWRPPMNAGKPAGSGNLLMAYPPYTYVSYQVREALSVELVSVGAGMGTGAAGGQSPSTQALDITPDSAAGRDLQQSLEAWMKLNPLEGFGIANLRWTGAAAGADGLVLKLDPSVPPALRKHLIDHLHSVQVGGATMRISLHP